MKITALGTGTSQGIPIVGCKCNVCLSTDLDDKRLRSSVYISTEQTKLLVDIGPDFRTQFLNNNLSTVDAVLVTHEHNDHIIGLDDIRSINYIQNKSVPIYGQKRVLDDIADRFQYAFQKKNIPGLPQIVLNEIKEDIAFSINDIEVTPLPILHGKLPILGYKLNDIAYITDASYISDKVIEKIKGVKVLIINALRKEDHFSHLNLETALDYISRIKPDKAYITHISHSMGLTAQWSQELPDSVRPLQDGLEIVL